MDENSKIKKEIEEYNNLILSNPTLIYNYYLRALLKFKIKDYAGTCKDLEFAIELGLKDYSIFFALGVSYYENSCIHWHSSFENYKQAIRYLTKSINIGNSDLLSEKENVIGSILYDTEINLCKKEFNEFQKSHNYLHVYSLRGMIFMKMSDNESALKDFNKAIEMNPNNFYPYFLRGKLFYKISNLNNSLNDLLKSIELCIKFNVDYTARELYLNYSTIIREEFKTNRNLSEQKKSDEFAEMFLISMLKLSNPNVTIDKTNSIYILLDTLQKSFYSKQHNNDWIAFNKANNLNYANDLKDEDITIHEINAKNLMEYKLNYTIGFGKYKGEKLEEILMKDSLDILDCIINITHFAISNQILIEYYHEKGKIYDEAVIINVLKLKLIKQRKAELENEKNGYVNENGVMISRINDFEFYKFEKDLIFIRKDNDMRVSAYYHTYGIINSKGDFLTPCVISDINEFSEDMAAIGVFKSSSNVNPDFRPDVKHTEYGYINRTGKIVIDAEYGYAYKFINGVACVDENIKLGYEYDDQVGRYRLINNVGDKYSIYSNDPIDFKGNFAIVSHGKKETRRGIEGGKYGLINNKPNYLIDTEFDKIEVYEKDNIIFTSTLVILHAENSSDFVILHDEMEKVKARFFPQFNWYSYKVNTEDIENFRYDCIGIFSEGCFSVRKDNKWGFVDVNLNEIINFKYQKVGQFKEGFAKVCLNNKWGFINKIDESIIPCVYDDVSDFTEGFTCVTLDNKMSIINPSNKMIIDFIYDNIEPFKCGYSIVKKDTLYGIINTQGEICLPAEYYSITGFRPDYFLVKKDRNNIEIKFFITSDGLIAKESN